MITVTKTFVRPSVDILWNTQVISTAPIMPFLDQYQAEGKYISETITYPDQFTKVLVDVWDTIESFNQFCQIPEIIEYCALRDEYNAQNNISFNRLIEDSNAPA